MLPRGDKIIRFKTYVLREIIHQGSLKHPFIVTLKEARTHSAAHPPTKGRIAQISHVALFSEVCM